MKNILFLLLTFLLIVPNVYGFEYRIGTSYERMDPELSAIRDLNSDENKFPYYTSPGTASLADLTPFARTILDDADAAAVRSTIGAEQADADIAKINEAETITGNWELPWLNLDKRASAPGSPVAGRPYYADGTTWDPAGLGISKAYYVIYDGADYIPLFDEDGDRYVRSIETPTLESDQLNDTSDPHLLVVSELKNTILSNINSTGADEWDFPARTEGWFFVFVKEVDQNIALDPNGSENWYFRTDNSAYTLNGAGTSIINTTAGRSSITCFSTEDAVYCTGDSNWEQGS